MSEKNEIFKDGFKCKWNLKRLEQAAFFTIRAVNTHRIEIMINSAELCKVL